MANSNPPYGNASNAAQFAGYAQFYGTPQPPRGPPTFARPPPGPAGYGMRMQHQQPPRGTQWAPRGPPGPPGPRGPAPRPAGPNKANPWAWGNGGHSPATVVAAAPPVMYNNNGRGPPAAAASRPSPAPAPATSGSGDSTATVNSTKWPDALHDYVKRAFARCKGAADQSLTQNALKTLITNAIMTSTLWTKNWHAEPLPTLVGDTIAAKSIVQNPHAPPRPRGPMPPPPMMHDSAFRPPHQMHAPPPRGGAAPAFMGFNQAPTTKGQKRKAEKIEDMNKKHQRKERFANDQYENAKYVTPTVDLKKLRVLNLDGELDLEAMTIKGTCQTIEKEYLRLTSPPHESTVRPEPILKKALEMVKGKWRKSECDYIYACSQLKSIRQDCTVQRIKNAFTVLVYETHARVALESGDINEFNQCQTQLHELYEKSIPGQAIEFLSYRILYCIYVSLQAKKADSNAGQLGMYSVLSSITPALREHESVRHALAVRQAVAANDFHRFFKLLAQAPKMAGYLMDPLVPTIRLRALRAICKAYKPDIPIDFVRQELNLEGKAGDTFIQQSGIVFVKGTNNELVDTKASDIVWVLSDQSSLI